MPSSNPGSEKSPEFTWVEAAEAGTHSNQCLCANLFIKLHRSLALAPFWAFFEVITARARPDGPVAQEAGTGAKVQDFSGL